MVGNLCYVVGAGWQPAPEAGRGVMDRRLPTCGYVSETCGYVGTQVGNLCYLAAASSAFFRSSTISFWMLPGVGRYFANSIVNTPWPCVMLRRSVE